MIRRPSPHTRHSGKTLVIPATPRHSRGRGNPEKNKARRLPPPSRSVRGRERSERGMPETPSQQLPPPTTPIPSPARRERVRVRANRAAMGRTRQQPNTPFNATPPAPSFPRTCTVIPADAGTQRKAKHVARTPAPSKCPRASATRPRKSPPAPKS